MDHTSIIEPDTKDWTWVLGETCPECRFDTRALDLGRLPQAIRDNGTLWRVVLGTDDAAVRPAPHIWSPLEYACHVRDVNRLFDQRVRRMLDEDDPRFENWDQDLTAVEDDYGMQRADAVGAEVIEAAERVASTYEQVDGAQWERRGTRSNGDVFTVDTLARYHLHDVVHHAHDVSHVTKRITVDSYEADAEAYGADKRELTGPVRAQVEAFAAAVGPGGRVLEIGTAQGRDADALERLGLSVRRTDITPAFVRLLRGRGIAADVLDPLANDLSDPDRDHPYDGVWAAASLLHIRREELPEALRNLARVTRPGGVLGMSVKEGDGARFSVHGSVAGPRHFTYWREQPLVAALAEAGWEVVAVEREVSPRDEPWLAVRATRAR